MLKKMDAGNIDPAAQEKLAAKVDTILDILMLMSRDTSLKFDEQKKRLDSVVTVVKAANAFKRSIM